MTQDELRAKVKELRLTYPEQLAKELCELCAVQPMDNFDIAALADDSLAQALLGSFWARNTHIPNE